MVTIGTGRSYSLFINSCVNIIYHGAQPMSLIRWLRPTLLVFAFGCIFQLIYGGLVYFALQFSGLFTLPIILCIYLLPFTLFYLVGIDRAKDLLRLPYKLSYLSILAIAGWSLIRWPLFNN